MFSSLRGSLPKVKKLVAKNYFDILQMKFAKYPIKI